MAPFLVASTARLVGTIPLHQVAAASPALAPAPPHADVLPPAILNVVRMPVPFPRPIFLQFHAPLYSSRNGNLFADRFDDALHWYLPEFALLDGDDPAFSFVATQSGQDEAGRPFFSAEVCLTLRKSMPPDAAAFLAGNVGAAMREISLAALTVTLASEYTDDQGTFHQKEIAGVATDAGGGNLALRFAPILGAAVAAVYNDLTSLGKAQVRLAATFSSWSSDDRPMFLRAQILRPQMLALAQPASPPAASASMFAAATLPRPMPVPIPAPSLNLGQLPWTESVSAGAKFGQAAYQLKYATQIGDKRQVIRDVGDLSNFAQGGSEFRELLALGALGEKYPSIGKAYVGRISRTIVVIPRRYSILRTKSGCAASCTALVDSTPGSVSACKFELDFTIAPNVSPIELAQLAAQIAAMPELEGYSIKFPDFLGNVSSCNLLTTFVSDARFALGPISHTFSVTLVIQDQGGKFPAVASVNLVIAQLCSTTNNGLTGSIAVTLDDEFPTPITPALDLNFYDTVGSTDEVMLSSDGVSAEVKASSESVLNLAVARYAIATPSSISIHEGPWALPTGSEVLLTGSDATAEGSTIIETEVNVPRPLTKSAIANFLSIQTVDVQSTQYTIAVDADAIAFSKVDSIKASVTFDGLPQFAPTSLLLTVNLRADSFHIAIPLQYAIYSLPATVTLTVKWVDSQTADLVVSVPHDFSADPVLMLSEAMLEAGGAPPV